MRILAAQINPIVGDLNYNTTLILNAIRRGQAQQADIVLFPELALTGYPPEDLLLLPTFIEAVEQKLKEIVVASQGICVVVGLPRRNPLGKEKKLFNSAAIIHNQTLLGYVDKTLLPTYDVFDERRFFEPGAPTRIWRIADKKVGVTICEDIWQQTGTVTATNYLRNPISELQISSPDFILNLSASPYSFTKFNHRLKVCQGVTQALGCPLILCNQVGANDSLIFDGNSLYVNSIGQFKVAKAFAEDDLWISPGESLEGQSPHICEIEQLYQALVIGVRDYFHKQGLKKACFGLSGGIDSALVACVAAEALGAENLLAIYMPSRFSMSESGRDAQSLCEKLGIRFLIKNIENPFQCYLELFAEDFAERSCDITEENLQSRIRGMILMAFSNKFGYIVLSTGNKSELALGYSTLYGDMCGGLGVINDLTKRQVYALANWINRHEEVIPYFTIERAPSAELRHNQKDSDSMPEYQIVDNIVEAYVEGQQSPEWIANHYGYPLEQVKELVRRIHLNEYKRRQAPVGLRVTEKAFTVGRRFPIVQKWE